MVSQRLVPPAALGPAASSEGSLPTRTTHASRSSHPLTPHEGRVRPCGRSASWHPEARGPQPVFHRRPRTRPGAGLRGDPNALTREPRSLPSSGQALGFRSLSLAACLPPRQAFPQPVSHRQEQNHRRGAGLPAAPPPGGIAPQGQALASPRTDIFKWRERHN